ncbi:MAG: GTP 3',8-cyclase MoaA, partial [Acidobacteria bacterium]|nr:GTP 3',8-cyclase MoaA [Acidobacteriota bacterium]
MSLTDTRNRPLQDLRISVTDRCNFRCNYCMPEEVFGTDYRFLERDELLTFEEITRLASVLVERGVRRIRITGGEPLVRRNLDRLVGMLAALPGLQDLSLTTNGSLLPGQAAALAAAGLRRVTVSLDSLDEAVFRSMTSTGAGLAEVLRGIEAAGSAGLLPVKINAVVRRGVNDHTVVDLVRHFRGTGTIVRFIEYMDVGNSNGWSLEEVVPAAEILARINAVFPLEPMDPNQAGEVARRWRLRDGSAEIGVITSVSNPFCAACCRLRLSPEGSLFTCLFAGKGFDLRGLLRQGADNATL